MKIGKKFYALAVEGLGSEKGNYAVLGREPNHFKTLKEASLARSRTAYPGFLFIALVKIVEGPR